MAAFIPSEVITDPDELSASVKLIAETRDAADEILIDTTTLTIVVEIDAANVMLEAGLTLKCLYSFLKDQWKANTDLIKFPFPMIPITDEQFEFTNGWNLDGVTTSGTSGATTQELIRTGGWAVNAGPGTNDTERWRSVITLGALETTDQVYYRQIVDATTDNTTNFLLTGQVNQAVQYYLDTNADGAADNNYATELTLFVRSWAKTYASANLVDIGAESGTTYQTYRFPLASVADVKVVGLNISETAASGVDVDIDSISGTGTVATVTTVGNHGFIDGDVVDIAGAATGTGFNTAAGGVVISGVTATTFDYANTETTAEPSDSPATASGTVYNNMSISWADTGDDTSQTGFNNIANTSIPTAYFTVVIDADVSNLLDPNPSAEQIYAYVQAQLRKTGDINANFAATGTRAGNVTPAKLQFIGDDLFTLGQTSLYEGVYINDYRESDANRLHFWGYGSESNTSYNILTITRATNVVTVTTSASHDYTTGDYITIAGTIGAATDLNGTYVITVTDVDEFTYANTGGDESGTAATGTTAPAQFTNITFPFVAILTINFGSNLVDDADAIYKVFFANDDAGDNTARDYGTKDAIVVNDASASPMAGNVSAQAFVERTYAYDSNVQRGSGSENTPAPVVAVALGLNTAQYISSQTTINKSIANSVALVAPLERNYTI